jgi:hypothetical protein
VPDEADGLYGLPPEEFTAARNAAAKELRKAGERKRADRVAALRKPSRAAGAINMLARTDRDLVDAVIAAGARLRAAQEGALGGGSADELREAARAERDAVEAASGAAGKAAGLTGANLQRIRSSLHAAATDDDVRDQIAAGRLVADHEPVGLGPFGAGAAAPASKAKPKAPAKRASKQSAEARRRITDAQRDERRAARDLEAAERAHEKQREAVERARARLAETEAALSAARSEHEDASKRLAKAERDAG